jgi:hypothetical protein
MAADRPAATASWFFDSVFASWALPAYFSKSRMNPAFLNGLYKRFFLDAGLNLH